MLTLTRLPKSIHLCPRPSLTIRLNDPSKDLLSKKRISLFRSPNLPQIQPARRVVCKWLLHFFSPCWLNFFNLSALRAPKFSLSPTYFMLQPLSYLHWKSPADKLHSTKKDLIKLPFVPLVSCAHFLSLSLQNVPCLHVHFSLPQYSASLRTGTLSHSPLNSPVPITIASTRLHIKYFLLK